jgi:hypothetical protein
MTLYDIPPLPESEPVDMFEGYPIGSAPDDRGFRLQVNVRMAIDKLRSGNPRLEGQGRAMAKKCLNLFLEPITVSGKQIYEDGSVSEEKVYIQTSQLDEVTLAGIAVNTINEAGEQTTILFDPSTLRIS